MRRWKSGCGFRARTRRIEFQLSHTADASRIRVSPDHDQVESSLFAGSQSMGNGDFNRSVVEEVTVDLLKRSEEHTSELQSLRHLVCRLLLEKKKNKKKQENIKPTENTGYRVSVCSLAA